MATTTPNLGLTLPAGTEKVSRTTINANNTLIDAAIGEDRAAIAALEESASLIIGTMTVDFVAPSTSTPAWMASTIDNACGTTGKTLFNTVILASLWHNANNGSWYNLPGKAALQQQGSEHWIRLDGSESAFFSQPVKVILGFLPEQTET